ncbi:uncharacterized protein PFL1_05568 [Pseudozyma flocculosa PF-1]|uniref:Calcineurin-like phosphoesterase domain-containing protein n=2 Tax=Pseudozyma flocculosa TaxID=84751 RepID=A0A5C3F9N9_9BASI|nr:uncharacterized protein PFL1_05568 [Pseudozyma flocculosa PF-1]EPQ26934.1 hypothetical protein PFL1_05568 [Pseudozyma flocculosa PF-1]SPO41158.1 uncharacterized protein PSFLO_06640 [Pseudozyma flocculosa]
MSILSRPRLLLLALLAVGLYHFAGPRISLFAPVELAQGDVGGGGGGGDHSTGSLGAAKALKDGRRTISKRTVAVADLHGDLEHALNVFRMASLVSSTSESWIAGHDTLVSTGDIVDRGDDTIKLYRLFRSLRMQSKQAGGEVRNLVGNHEVMNALGDWRYVTKGDIESFGGAAARRTAMSTQGWIGQEWLRDYNVTTTVPLLPPDHPGLPKGYTPPSASFVHGGITPAYAERGIDEINRIAKSLLRKGLDEERPSGWLPPDTTPEEQAVWSESGPLWYRGYATEDEPEACRIAEKATSALGVRHLVMGHTPHFDGFVMRCPSAEILLIDTGISRAYGGEQSALVIDFELVPLPSSKQDGDRGHGKQELWRETETLSALYRGRKPKVLKRLERDLWL